MHLAACIARVVNPSFFAKRVESSNLKNRDPKKSGKKMQVKTSSLEDRNLLLLVLFGLCWSFERSLAQNERIGTRSESTRFSGS